MTVVVPTLALFQLWLTHRIYRNHVGAGPKFAKKGRF